MKQLEEIISAFLNWYSADSISSEEDYYQDTMTESYLNGLDQGEFIQFFFQFAREGGKVQTGGERTAGKLKQNIVDDYEEFRTRIMEPFQKDFDLDAWLGWVEKFTYLGKGLATIFLNRVDKNRYVIVNDKSIEAYRELGFDVRYGKLTTIYRDLEKAQNELLDRYPEMENFYKLDALSQYLIGTEEGRKWLEDEGDATSDGMGLQPFMESYKAFIQSGEYDEWYKWEAFQNFQDHWDLEAADFKAMFERSLQPENCNLWSGSHFRPRRAIVEWSSSYPEEVREMFKVLFDEKKDISERINFFQSQSQQLQERLYPGEGLNDWQDKRAVMLYLSLRYPEKYYLYQYTMYRDFCKAAKICDRPSKSSRGNNDIVFEYLKTCDQVKRALEKDKELIQLHRSLRTDKHFHDPENTLLTQDFIYTVSKGWVEGEFVGVESSGEESEVAELANIHYWLYAPGENARLWDRFREEGVMAIGWNDLGNLQEYDSKESIAEKLQEIHQTTSSKSNDALACYEFAHKIQEGDIIIAKKGRSDYIGWGIVTSTYRFNPQREDYYHERKVEWRAEGKWTARSPIVTKTLTDITKYPDYVKRLIGMLNINTEVKKPIISGSKNFWWLNANPKIWSIEDTQVGAEQSFTTYNERGNKRRIYKYFTEVTPGDLVIGYETTPTKKVKALFEITRGIHHDEDDREVFSFKKIQDVTNPIFWEDLRELQGLENCEVFKNNQGSLFKISEEEFDIIRDLIDEKEVEEEIATNKAEPYILNDALSDLFLSEMEFERIVKAIRHKKNVVLQGPPGVGKTFIAKKLAKRILGKNDESKIEMVQFHQSYAYEDFIQGIRPVGQGNFKTRKGIFYRFCERAQTNPGSDYFFIIDEINRGNLSKIFGELMMLIEADKRGEGHSISLTYSDDGEVFYIPENLHLIGTMNTADRSLAMVDYALRRRFAFIDLAPNFNDRFRNFLAQEGLPDSWIDKITDKLDRLNTIIAKDQNLGKGFQVGHSYFCSLGPLKNGATPEEWYRDIIDLEIAPLLQEYWFDKEDIAKKEIEALKR